MLAFSFSSGPGECDLLLAEGGSLLKTFEEMWYYIIICEKDLLFLLYKIKNMKAFEVNQLLGYGARDRVRMKLKKLALPERMKSLSACIPFVKASPQNLKFFKENFSAEIGAILIAEGDVDHAVSLYHAAKRIK